MTRERQDRLLSLLSRDEEWVTAGALADVLGVTPRSIRSYVNAINSTGAPGAPGATVLAAIDSGPLGYRINRDGVVAYRAATVGPEGGTPRDRLHTIVRALLDDDDGIDVFATADALHVSSSTFEADLSRVRALLSDDALQLDRAGPRVAVRGPESAKRRLISRLAHDEMDDGRFDLEALRRTLGAGQVGVESLGAFKADLAGELGRGGYFVNEYGISDVLMHIGIAVDRVSRHRELEGGRREASTELPPVADQTVLDVLHRRVAEHFSVDLGQEDLQHLATLLMTRVVTPGPDAAGIGVRGGVGATGAGPTGIGARLDPVVHEAVRSAVSRAASEFLVDIEHDDFIDRLTLHVQNLLHRARVRAYSRNPLTRSIKSSYPMIFEVAVFIASALQEHGGIEIHDDKIAYIAMHIGGRLEQSRRRDVALTATIVCPGYYELHELLRSSIARSLGGQIEVIGVETRGDPDWASLPGDLVLTTIDPPPRDERVVRVQPFLTESDVERVRAAVTKVRRTRRLARLRAELLRYFHPETFVRASTPDGGEEGVIRELGALLVARGVIDEGYVERTIERERMSSTAFTDALAVPHALQMSASQTSIAIAVNEQSIPWGDARVQVVALVAFSESDRAAFQTVFEQFVEVFSERESVQRIVRRSGDFAGFIDELAAVIDG